MELAPVRPKYVELARRWVAEQDADSLAAAYDLGTAACRGGARLTDLLALHHEVMSELAAAAPAADFAARAGALAGELVAPFEFEIGRLRDFESSQQSVTSRLRQQAQILDRVNEALRAARADAEAATQAKAAFLAHMSHEIRTPLNAVIGLSGLMLETRLDEQQQDFARTISTSGEHLLTVINDILDFSKIEAGKLELELLPMNLATCVEEALDLLAVRAADKNLELAYFIEPETPRHLRCDLGRIRQVLLNLLSNGVKFTQSGEVTVTVRARALAGARHEWHFAVRDTGPGIPPAVRERLFRPFEQASAATTRLHGGTGLGLSISGQLVALLGGRVWIESEVGAGSTFHFTVCAEVIDPPIEANDPRGEQLKGRRILVVDDNPTNRRILSAYIQAWGMVPIEAESPFRALELVSDSRPLDLAILDYQMPEMLGPELGRRLRRLPGREALPMILLSSVLAKQKAAEAEGFSASLMKPIKPSPLFSVVAEILAEPLPAPAHPDAALPAAAPAERRPLRILVADDNALNRKVADQMLRRMGYEPAFAPDGKEAVRAVAERTFDLLLMDMEMPEMDGLEATRVLVREYDPRHRPYIIAMTANATDEDRRACLAAGMDGYLSKPVTVAKLTEVITSYSLRPRRNERPQPAPAAPAPAAPPELSLADQLRARFAANPAELDRRRALLQDETLALRRAADRGDAAAGRRHAGNLAAAAAELGGEALRAAGQQLAGLADGAFLAGAVVLAAAVQSESDALREVLEKARAPLAGAADAADRIDAELLGRLRQAGRDAGLRQRVEGFPAASAALMQGLEGAVASRDASAAARLASELAELGAPFPSADLLSSVRALESAARDGDLVAAKSLLAAVRAEHGRFCRTLARA